jgi:Zn-finger nucleic acid-binding protein
MPIKHNNYTKFKNCPNDNNILEEKELEKSNIIVHQCPYCGGIWMDRINTERLFHSAKKSDVFIRYLAKILNIEITEI